MQCAKFELAEEANLRTSDKNFIALLPEDVCQSLDKYSDNEFYPYLVINPSRIPLESEEYRNKDEEEFIITEPGLTYRDIMKLIKEGKINIVSTYTFLMAFKKLEEMGISYK